jgi:hypothetical protein
MQLRPNKSRGPSSKLGRPATIEPVGCSKIMRSRQRKSGRTTSASGANWIQSHPSGWPRSTEPANPNGDLTPPLHDGAAQSQGQGRRRDQAAKPASPSAIIA